MEKLVYKHDKDFGYWTIASFTPYPKSEMILLKMSFYEKYDWIIIDSQNNEVSIWDSFDEKDACFEKIPKLKMSQKNYDQVLDQWNQNLENSAPYLIFSRDTTGWITLEAKDALSAEDFMAIEEDKQAGKEWKENWKKQFNKKG